MIYKILGGLILMLAGGYVSVAVSRFEHRRLAVLDGYMSLIYYIKGQIDCYARPLADILRAADPAVLALCVGAGSADDLPPLPYHTESPLDSLIRESHLYLEPSCERLLITFSGELGHTFRAEQVARCEHYIGALAEERRRLGESIPARVRVAGMLSMCCAMGAAILFW